ncbi:sugar porter family MFS transporter [Xanthocytophaga agilis]|uniref:Sugar porter family MFS transporter n=1 Tax=Xanthocytophaga agilis TaxID=3048010 RepID=A0AAE3UH28_9BACT|nr:sugar porter family MFS transporter [Xanthocytophaga agilis]MDJ1505603.1 sugar porter family MFS transporter [Xanthocytophaga agilis]
MANSLFVLRVCLVAALGGLLFGYDTAVIAGAIGFLQARFDLSPTMVGWVASSAIWGCVAGVAFAGYLSDQFGRKKALLLTAFLFTISGIATALPNSLSLFILARFVGGLAIGAASMLSPLYIAEIAPPHIRGRLVTLYQLAIVIGINLIYYVNMQIAAMGDQAWNTQTGWRIMLGSETIPAILFGILLFFVPESPRWLIKQGKIGQALDILKAVNGTQQAESIREQIRESLEKKTGTFSDLFAPGLRKALSIGVVLALFSQITGINAIIYFAPEIFKRIGFSADSAFMQTFLIGIINTIFTIVALWLVDWQGRRKLLLWGVAGMTICLGVVGYCFYFSLLSGPWLLIAILAYIACFASSLGPIPWIIISEIFPTQTRGVAMSVATGMVWVGVLLITQFTPILLDSVGGAYLFWIFMGNSIVLFLFTLKNIPETKNLTLEEIEQQWK